MIKSDLGTHLQVGTDLNAEAAVKPILEVVEIVIVITHAATRECACLLQPVASEY